MDEGIGLFEADALIRAVLHLDPSELTDSQWVYYTLQAIWMESYRVGQIGKRLGA